MNAVKMRFGTEPSEKDCLEDLLKQRLQLFDPDIDTLNPRLTLSDFLLNWNKGSGSGNSITPLTVLGFKATKFGLLKCSPTLPIHRDEEKGIVIAAVEEKHGWMEAVRQLESRSTKFKRTGLSVDELDYDTYQTDFDGVASHAGAITSFHVDSMMSGGYIHMIKGIKIVCSCPSDDQNWEMFKGRHLKSHPDAG